MDTENKPKFDAKAAQRALYEQQLADSKTNVTDNKKTVDNDKNNDYIKTDTTNADNNADSGDDKVKNLLEKTFNNNTEELAKAYLNSQREYQKIRQTTKQQEEVLNYFKQLSEKSPMFEKVLDALENDIPLETVLQSNAKQEPKQVNQHTTNGKSNNVSVFDDIPVGDLVSNGYLDKYTYDNSSSIEREAMLQRARMNYMPKYMAKQAANEYQREMQEIEKRRTIEQKKQELQRRYNDSFDNVISKYNFDFTKNPEILDEVDALVPTFLDPKDRSLYREDAFERAFLDVVNSKKIQLEKVEFRNRDNVLNSGIQLQSGNPKKPTNVSVEDQFTNAYADRYKSRMEARAGWRR